MKTSLIEIEERVDELLVVLDKDIEYLRRRLSQLNELRSLVIKRDDVALSRLLENNRLEADSYIANELKRLNIRKELAVALGCDFDRMTLSRLELELPAQKSTQIQNRKTQLNALIGQLKKEYLSTSLLLSEFARFNSLVLRKVLGAGATGTVTYNSNGQTKRHGDTNFMNLHL